MDPSVLQSALPLMLLGLPLVAIVYALSAAVFVAAAKESPLSQHISQLWPRISVFMAALAVLSTSKNAERLPLAPALSLGLLLNAFAVYLMVHTRKHVIEGGEAPPTTNMHNKVVVITGANTGIGLETARALFQQGATVVLACRNVQKAKVAVQNILASTKHKQALSPPSTNLHIVPLDLSSLSSVRKAATMVLHQFTTIHVLINNAGVMQAQQFTTQDGYEMVMQANHLGHYLWTRLLLPHLSTQEGRILCLTSSTYQLVDSQKDIDLDNLFCQKPGQGRPYTMFGQYAMSKLANILFVQELTRRYGGKQLFVAAIHPGLVRTDVVKNMPWYLRYPNQMFAIILSTLQKTPAQGAWCTLYLAMADMQELVNENGQYWVNQQVQPLQSWAQNPEHAQQLWEDSAKYVHWKDN
jgi:NAD(P)-dependent dehydrogenase (short-subunit alcohol dehydrogenase family)